MTHFEMNCDTMRNIELSYWAIIKGSQTALFDCWQSQANVTEMPIQLEQLEQLALKGADADARLR